MATGAITINPLTGEDAGPATRAQAPRIDPATGEDIPPVSLDHKQADRAADALVYSHLTGAPPSFTYENRDAIHKDFSERLGEYAEAGWKGLTRDSIIGEYLRGQISGPFENDDEVSKFVEGLGQMIGDLPAYLVGGGLGGLAGGAVGTAELPVVGTIAGSAVGVGAGAFGLTAGLRQWLVDKYSGKKISAFSEVMDVLEQAGKGALTGAAFGVAGEAAPLAEGAVAKVLGPRAYKTAAELATMTTVGSLLEGRVPTAHDFGVNAALLAAMHIGTLGVGAAKDYVGKTYVDSGVHPTETRANPDGVPPPVEQDDSHAPTGMLRPAIKEGDKVTPGEPGEHHQDILDRMEPEKKPAGDQSEEEIGEDAEAEHGFVDQQGRYYNRQDARKWVDENEPQVAANLEEAGAGELTTEDYNEAQPRDRAPSVPAPTAEVAAVRKLLTRIRDGSQASKFGAPLRTFFVGNRDARIVETNQLADSLRKVVPDYRDQEALSLMRDFKNNRADLEARRAQYEAGDNPKLKKLIPIIDRALNPSPEMLEADKQLTDYFTKRLDEGKRLGFVDSTISNEEYITHLLKPETEGERSGGGSSGPQIGRNFRFRQERKYETLLDALETGTVKVQTLNALDALTIYGQKHATAAATRIFINELKQSEMGKWGSKRGDSMPGDWVELEPGSGLFRNTVPYIDRETGEATFTYQSLMVPAKVRDAMRPIIDSTDISGIPGSRIVRAIQAYIKAAELGLSVFHMKAMSITALNNQGVSGVIRSMRSDMESEAFKGEEVDGVRSGLQTSILGKTVEAYRALTKETLPSRTDVITKLRSAPGIKQLDELSAALTHQTFDVIQRKFKVMDYSIKKASWMADHPEATGEELTDAKRGIAKEINAAYGGLNWEVLGASKMVRGVMQAILLAPDWTFSNVFNAKYAFEGGPAGAAARSFWIRSTVTGIAMTQAMSILVSGQMSSHPSEVYLGKDKTGREVYSDMFFAGAPKDTITFLNNVEDFGAIEGLGRTIASKLSPVFRGAGELAANRDWMGREIVKKGKGALTNTAAAAWHFTSEAAPVPFSVSNTVKMLTDTEHDYGFWDYASVVGGSPPRHVLPDGAKSQRKRKFSIRGTYR